MSDPRRRAGTQEEQSKRKRKGLVRWRWGFFVALKSSSQTHHGSIIMDCRFIAAAAVAVGKGFIAWRSNIGIELKGRRAWNQRSNKWSLKEGSRRRRRQDWSNYRLIWWTIRSPVVRSDQAVIQQQEAIKQSSAPCSELVCWTVRGWTPTHFYDQLRSQIERGMGSQRRICLTTTNIWMNEWMSE